MTFRKKNPMSNHGVFGILCFIGGYFFSDLIGSMTRVTRFEDNRVEEPTYHQEEKTSPNLQRETLEELFKETGSDKYSLHRYFHYYDNWFFPFRDKDISMLEIGVLRGASLRAWEKYFPNFSNIYGLGYGLDEKTMNVWVHNGTSERVKVLMGNQGKNETMKEISSVGPYDIIIDDGSHHPQHMIFSFFSLWTAVKPGGLYIVEDLETNYWEEGQRTYGYRLTGTGWNKNNPKTNAVEKFKQFIDILPRGQLQRNEISIMEHDDTICSIEWGKNLVKFRKCTTREILLHPEVPKSKDSRCSPSYKEWMVEAKKTNPATFRD